ncbi:MAG: hypothetical protein PHI24_13195 [Desulfitobacteriaceae bacterium]|nr:hypothetical protein [Desulfitobacteriaceae bacterium]
MSDKIITIIGGLIILGLAVMFGLKGMATEMGLIVVAGAICLAFLHIDKIQKFKGAGFEAEMKQAVAEANATVQQLREVAATSSEAILTDLMAGNFFDGTTLEKRIDLHDQIIVNLRNIGASPKQIEKADLMWRKGIGVIFHRGIRVAIEQRKNPDQINTKAEKYILDASKEFQDLLDFSNWQALSSKEMEEFISNRDAMNTEVKELLIDYAQFEEEGTFRRKDIVTIQRA